MRPSKGPKSGLFFLISARMKPEDREFLDERMGVVTWFHPSGAHWGYVRGKGWMCVHVDGSETP